MGLFATTKEWKEATASWDGIRAAPSRRSMKHPKGLRGLENGFLEKYFGTSHWTTPGLWVVPLVGYCLYLSHAIHTSSVVWSVFVAGILLWTFVEYLLHRFVFHLPMPKNPFLKELLFMMHGYHHEYPNDPGRLVAPPVLSWPIALVLVGVYSTLFQSYWLMMFAGTLAGYLGYDWVHYYTHHARPTTKVGKFVKQFHLAHHYQDNTSHFGLSSPLWDVVLGTFKSDKQKMRTGGTTPKTTESGPSEKALKRAEPINSSTEAA